LLLVEFQNARRLTWPLQDRVDLAPLDRSHHLWEHFPAGQVGVDLLHKRPPVGALDLSRPDKPGRHLDELSPQDDANERNDSALEFARQNASPTLPGLLGRDRRGRCAACDPASAPARTLCRTTR